MMDGEKVSALLAQIPPLAFGLLIGRIAPECASAELLSACTASSVLVGGLAAPVDACAKLHARQRLADATAAAITTLAPSLGCIRLCVASLAGRPPVTFGELLQRLARPAPDIVEAVREHLGNA